MDSERRRRAQGAVTTLASVFVAVVGAVSLAGTVRWVEIVDLFGGGSGAGAATTRLIVAGARTAGRAAP